MATKTRPVSVAAAPACTARSVCHSDSGSMWGEMYHGAGLMRGNALKCQPHLAACWRGAERAKHGVEIEADNSGYQAEPAAMDAPKDAIASNRITSTGCRRHGQVLVQSEMEP